MGENKRYYWLKFQHDFFNQKEIKKLRKIAGGDTYTIIYLKMQLLSLKNNGVLYYDGVEESFAEELALDIDEDVDNVRFTIMFLQKYGMIEEHEPNEFTLPDAVNNIGSETASTIRSRRHRDTIKALQCNTDATKGNTEKEREKDKEIEIEIDTEKEKKKRFSVKPFATYTKNSDLLSAINDFVEMRKKIKSPMTDRAIILMLKKLDDLASDDEMKVAILNQSILNSWKGIFDLKENGGSNNGAYNQFAGKSQTKTDKGRGSQLYPEESLPDFLA